MFLDNIAGLHILRSHGRGHVVVKNKTVSQPRSQVLSPTLGTKLHFHVNPLRKDSVVLITNIATLSRGCKPRTRWGNKQKNISDNALTSEYYSHGHARLRGQGLKRLAATYLNKYREIQVSVSKHWYVVVELGTFFFLVFSNILCVISPVDI